MDDPSSKTGNAPGRIPLGETFGHRDLKFVDRRSREASAEDAPQKRVGDNRRQRPADSLVVFPDRTLKSDEPEATARPDEPEAATQPSVPVPVAAPAPEPPEPAPAPGPASAPAVVPAPVAAPARAPAPAPPARPQPAAAPSGGESSFLVDLKRKVRRSLFETADMMFIAERSDDEIRVIVADYVVDYMERQGVNLSAIDQRRLTRIMLDDILGYGPLEPLLADRTVTDILVNGPGEIWVERNGKLEITGVKFDDNQHLRGLIDRILGTVNRRVDERTPLVDARLPDGSRINVIIPPASYRFASMSIRKFFEKHVTLDDLVKFGSLSMPLATLLKMAVKNRLNILVSGGTGSGKTTMLQALCHYASNKERIITIEDTAELQLQQPDVVSLEARPPNIEGVGEITISDLLRNSLRMRPDRIIVGEVRGAGAADMLQAMNTGHDGSIGTLHANSARDALSRFEYMVCMSPHYVPGRVTRQQIVNALDLVVHLERMKDGVRRVMSITEIDGMEADTMLTRDVALYRFEQETGDGKLIGSYELTELPPHFFARMAGLQLAGDEAELIRSYDGSPAGRQDDRSARERT